MLEFAVKGYRVQVALLDAEPNPMQLARAAVPQKDGREVINALDVHWVTGGKQLLVQALRECLVTADAQRAMYQLLHLCSIAIAVNDEHIAVTRHCFCSKLSNAAGGG